MRTLRTRRLAIMLGIAALTAVSSAHIGSPDTWFEGKAGSYPVRVLVRSPAVIPGLADVTIWATDDARKVWATPAYYNAGDRGLPPPDTARAVAGKPGAYSVQLWIMAPGSYSVRVTVDGTSGTGTVIVPISAAAFEVRGMDAGLGIVLAGAGLFLVTGLITIVGAAARESVLVEGQEPGPYHRRRARVAMGIAGAVIAALLWGGKVWWDAEDQAYRSGLGRPWTAETALVGEGAARRLRLTIPDSLWHERRITPLVPDHGKLMHLFLASETSGDGFAHLHPVSLDSANFEAALPPLPAGRYRVFADVTHESGFARTIVGSVTLPDGIIMPDSAPALDPDDSWRVGPPVEAAAAASLPDGSSLVWERRGPLRADEEAGLRFALRAPDGSPAAVEPYLGMAGHAVVMLEDGGVFIHLHPMGTISAAAQVVLTERTAADSARGSLGKRLTEAGAFTRHAGPGHAMTLPGTFAFPYAFPDTGAYRVWVQVKRNGKIETAAFRALVS
jgi:hypothetical protein